MANCCTSIIDRGCFYSCDTVTTGRSADQTGTHTVVLQPDGQEIGTNTVIAGVEITFSGTFFKEDGVSVFKILQPDGTFILDGTADCFQIDMTPSAVSANLVVTTCSEYDLEYGGDAVNDFIDH